MSNLDVEHITTQDRVSMKGRRDGIGHDGISSTAHCDQKVCWQGMNLAQGCLL